MHLYGFIQIQIHLSRVVVHVVFLHLKIVNTVLSNGQVDGAIEKCV